MATVPNPKTWAPGTIPTATDLNTDIRDAINFFKGPPRALVKNNADIDTASTTWTLVTWNQEDADTENIHSTSSNTSRLVAVTAGRYFVTINVRWEEFPFTQNSARQVQIRKNSGGNVASGSMVCIDSRHAETYLAGSIPSAAHGTCGYVFLNAGDYVEVFIWQGQDNTIGTDTSLILMTDTACVRFGMVRVSSL